MKRKINARFVLLTVMSVVLTLVLATLAYYELFKKEVLADLRSYTYVLEHAGVFDDVTTVREYTLSDTDVRITLIDPDGEVRYDSQADAEDMDNHENRPEIAQALQSGVGEAIRHSDTIGKNLFYYAVRMDNGSVLRVGKESGSIWAVFTSILPWIAGIGLGLILIGLVLSHYLTMQLLEPIERMANDMDHLDSMTVYKEMIPFTTKIRKQHEDIIKNAKMRQDFTANVSHELKTPLTAISGYSELIENGMATDADVQRFAGEIHKNSKRLLTLINDIIRLSELDVTEQNLITQEVDLYEIARTCVDMLQVNGEKHDISISLCGTSCTVNANREMMEELVYNLCDNAIRYNNVGGSVKVWVMKEKDHAILSVEDTGIGIPQEDQERIFERFYRVDKSRSKSTGGTGLGLAIVKHIVEQHDAKLEIHSRLGEGTEIRVIF
ncbi:MAG: ATP-binding protein [Lachnospiraceae bacterium]|nr:ATP-binding protein [Lachnospiraceae bacterium]